MSEPIQSSFRSASNMYIIVKQKDISAIMEDRGSGILLQRRADNGMCGIP
ncbi:hypothetical protein ACTHQ8_03965 [Lysinibacillus odysseyi]|nr:hypothetical protein [Lysinibacillus odysseyi]